MTWSIKNYVQKVCQIYSYVLVIKQYAMKTSGGVDV
jgi:hypothetical protein